MTLGDYFPKSYLTKVSVNTVSSVVIEEDRDEDAANKESPSELDKDAKIDAILDALPSRMGWQQMFHLPEEMHQQLSLAILHPTRMLISLKLQESRKINRRNVIHSRKEGGPHISGRRLSRQHNAEITMEELGILVNDLAKSHLMIQCFNLGGQRATDMIRVELAMGDMSSTTLFNAIDAKTSYKLLLGRPWLHENGVVASTLHQCLKYYRDGERKINGDVKPFSTMESYFADARFYEEVTPSEILPSTILSTWTKVPKKVDDIKVLAAKESMVVEQRESILKKTNQKNVDSSTKKVTPNMPKAMPIFKYVPKSKCKNGEAPFTEYTPREEASTSTRTINEDNLQTLKEKLIVLVTRTDCLVTSKQPLPGFTKGLMKEDQAPAEESTKGRFDPNTYKLMSKSGYDFENPTPLGQVIEVTPYGLNQTQKKLHQQGNKLEVVRAGIGFSHPEPIRIYARRKEKQALSKYIVAELAESEGDNTEMLTRRYVFDRLGPPTSTPRSSVFNRLGEREENICVHLASGSQQQGPNKSVFTRIGGKEVKKSVFSRIDSSKVQKRRRRKQKKSLKAKVAVDLSKDTHSVIPSRMKRHLELEITMDGSLKTKGRTIVFTNPKKESSHRRITQDFVASNHVTAQECQDSDDEIEVEKTVYVNLLSEYKDVFAWSYKEIPGLSPKIAVHRLAVWKGISPKKQPRRRFRSEMLPEIEVEVNKLIDAGFITEVKYPTWIANIVPVRKNNGQLRICVDFRDLNDAYPKDDFSLPVTEIMIDATTGHEALSFMDCTAGYNQIQMAPEDEEATAFRTPKGIFCYKVMPFGLKNAGAMYQRAM
ncbi:uncharacterized protein LOC141620315 [Silene latifolia]|uniref:uncharacterized protein LOC141620315 n=1 Tax=Silene latifolia TaxID=37657 RepID=UPI003D775452